jgi:hypothetical protein
MRFPQYFVIPAKAGIQEISGSLDSRLRGNDVWMAFSDKLLALFLAPVYGLKHICEKYQQPGHYNDCRYAGCRKEEMREKKCEKKAKDDP